MSVFDALLSGFSSFFSVWQVCILQISPFFMVYLLGMYATALTGGKQPTLMGWAILPAVAYALGFSVFFGLLSASGLYAGRYLNYYISELRVGAGVFFLLIVGWFVYAHRLRLGAGVAAGVTGGVGVALALIYSPCITPALSQILGVAARPETAQQGAKLAFFYGLGMSLAFGLVGTVLVGIGGSRAGFVRQARIIQHVCAGALLLLALMNITGFMTYYKAFFLGLFVP